MASISYELVRACSRGYRANSVARLLLCYGEAVDTPPNAKHWKWGRGGLMDRAVGASTGREQEVGEIDPRCFLIGFFLLNFHWFGFSCILIGF